ncbi:MAG TPA: hypothetical protein VJU78_02200 [Chitinophagaceae bacterium]|nr:hypothetical protein [Chitinophagaceae bacterium]
MVSVFKTSVSSKKKVKMVKPHLDNLHEITKWNFDLHDCDNILRIESNEEISLLVINVLKKSGFQCLELE